MENIWSSDYQNKQQRSVYYDRQNFKYNELLAEQKRIADVKLNKVINDNVYCNSNNSK